MTWSLHRHDARRVSELLEPESVDAVITSPPYWEQRDYRDAGQSYPGQMGSERTAAEWLDNLVAATADWIGTVKRSGSIFVNLSDKMVNKHRLGLPWRYAIRCIDELGLILRADIIWVKPNGLPESVTDRVRMSHEYLFHFTRQGRYFAAIDEIREAHKEPERIGTADSGSTRRLGTANQGFGVAGEFVRDYNPLGKAPSSVWSLPSEPLSVPDHLGVDHFAAYPSELVRRCVLGWTPSGWCTACGEARRPVVDKTKDVYYGAGRFRSGAQQVKDGADEVGWAQDEKWTTSATITGYACACPTTDAPTTPAVVLDPFAGTGTTVLVADQLGRHAVGVDLSADYLRLAEWRIRHDTHTHRKVRDRSGLTTPQPPKVDGQLGLFEGLA